MLVLGHLVPLIEAMDVLERLRKGTWHLLVQVLMVPFMFLDSVLYELVRACLLDVIVEPWQVELIHAETHQVQERLDVVDWRCIWMYLVLSQGSKHGVSFEMLDLAVCSLLVRLQDVLSECEVDQVIVAIRDANVVQFQVPVAVTYLVKFVKRH